MAAMVLRLAFLRLIVKLNDDVISASRYAMMMLRFAITEPKRSTLGAGHDFKSRRAGY